jgi:hypothetical protein
MPADRNFRRSQTRSALTGSKLARTRRRSAPTGSSKRSVFTMLYRYGAAGMFLATPFWSQTGAPTDHWYALAGSADGRTPVGDHQG